MSQLKLTIVGDPQPLRNATRVAEKSLRNLSKVASNVGNSMNKALGAVGLGVGLATLTNGLKNATKAASDDRKSQGLLANALQNTVGATESAIAGAEQYIKKTQLSSAVLDDELRPALANAVRATGSLAGGQRLLDVALDISASTGKDLSSVTGALSKAFNGNTASLKKLIPGIQLTDNWMGELETKFAGASETAANLDPYKRLEVIFADIQETIGTALLPALEEFSAYLASPAGQENVREIVNLFVTMGQAIGNVITFLVRNISIVKAVVAEIVLLKFAWMTVQAIVKLYELGVIKATVATKALKWALVSTGLGAIAVAVGSIAAAWLETTENTEDAQDAAESYLNDPAIIRAIQETNRMRDEILANEAERLRLLTEKKNKIVQAAKSLADAVRKALDSKIEGMKRTGEKFRDAVGIAFGVFGEDEYTVFNEQVFIDKLKRMVTAAKGFAENIKKLRTAGADETFIDEIVGMGPAQGNIVAQGLLSGGNLKEILGLRKSLYGTGTQVGAQQAMAGNATYEININKAVISASDIIREIKLLEKKSGRKYLVN
jgi:hypothetical protein